jgi:TldD protein
MLDHLKQIIKQQQGYVELRYHDHQSNAITAQKGRIDQASSSRQKGVGIRVLENGAWGFSSTSRLDNQSIEKAIDIAREAAIEVGQSRREKSKGLQDTPLSDLEYDDPAYLELLEMPFKEKIDQVIEAEQNLEGKSSKIHTARIQYSELFEHKIIVTSDGAACSRKLVRPEYKTTAFAGKGDHQLVGFKGVGVSGNWKCLFEHPTSSTILEDTAKEAVDLLSAHHVEGGKKTVILSPSLVGLLCHEAIGHTVEADFVQAGSVAQGKLGQQIASPLITLCDSGRPPFSGGPGGYLPFDDEGVPCQTTTIIEQGRLNAYLHDRESAKLFGVAPKGNARAWSYSDEPLIRMTNTYLRPGNQSLEDIIASTDDGLFITGAGNGQADATGEFMFGASSAYEIKNGKLGRMFREVTLAGIAFDVLKTVDAVSNEFQWDLGSGYCGKGQPAKVDAGGPYIRCQINIGGR